MTKEQLAEQLDGREYGREISPDECNTAKTHGLLVMFGYSDDNVELKGAIHDEVGGYGGVSFKIHRKDILPLHADCDCEYCGFDELAAKCATIEASFGDNEPGYAWRFETKIPHATFEICEAGEVYSQGIVISVEDLPEL